MEVSTSATGSESVLTPLNVPLNAKRELVALRALAAKAAVEWAVLVVKVEAVTAGKAVRGAPRDRPGLVVRAAKAAWVASAAKAEWVVPVATGREAARAVLAGPTSVGQRPCPT